MQRHRKFNILEETGPKNSVELLESMLENARNGRPENHAA